MMRGGLCLCTRILQVEGLEPSSLESAINSRTGMIEPLWQRLVVANPVRTISASLLSLPNLCFITCALFPDLLANPQANHWDSKLCTNLQSIENKRGWTIKLIARVGEITWIWGIW
jgi:hypothetical protein